MDYQRYADEHHLEVAIEDRLATITLNRPDVRNAVNYEMHTGLESIFREIGRDPDVGAILLTGAGKAFCAAATSRASAGPMTAHSISCAAPATSCRKWSTARRP